MRWFALIVLAVLAVPAPAYAQDQATVVATCGAAHLTAGTQAFRQVDTNGVTCSAGGGSAVVSSVWSASDAAANGMTLTNGGLTIYNAGGQVSTRATSSHTAGKYYVEFLDTAGTTWSSVGFGLGSSGININTYLGNSNYSAMGFLGNVAAVSSGFVQNGALITYTPLANDVFQLAVDLTTGKLWFGLNNTWYSSGNPATGINPYISIVSPALGLAFYPAIYINGGFPTGPWTLQPTAASQKYAPPTGFTAWDSGGATGCSQATAYLARATGETAHAADLTTLICGLVSDGVWSKLDAFYIFAQQTQADANLNLIGTSYPITVTGAPTFTQYRGYNFAASGQWLDTGFNAATAVSPNFTQNSANLGAWVNVYAASSAAIIGNSATGATGESHIYPNNAGQFYARVNGSSAGVIAPVAQIGLYVGDRSGAASKSFYFNGSSLGTDTTDASQAPFNGNFRVGFVSAAGSPDQIAEAHIGGSLGSAGNLALYTRLRTYGTAVGLSLLRENLPNAKPNAVKP